MWCANAQQPSRKYPLQNSGLIAGDGNTDLGIIICFGLGEQENKWGNEFA